MYLKMLHLRQFRNYGEQQVTFQAPKTILVGDNAQGKSNLLEGVALLSTLKSSRAASDRDLISNGASTAQLVGTLERQIGLTEMAITLRRTGRRTVALDRENCRRQLDFLGILNMVEFSSLDLELVRGAPESRRRWLDNLVVQLEPVYAHIAKQYDRILRQRNALVRQHRRLLQDIPHPTAATNADPLNTTLPVLNLQLATEGTKVMRRRLRALARLTPLAQAWHQAISGQREQLSITYAANVETIQEDTQPEQLRQAFLDRLEQKAIAETHQGTTLVGPHRDEIILTINDTPARQYGSQGQQRTLVLALKLAELQLIEEVVGEPPILLLDDVLAELDPHRQWQLLEAIEDRFQTLIATTHLTAFDAQWLRASQILSVRAGQVLKNSQD
jgi:DNA replication and repair protein RecF